MMQCAKCDGELVEHTGEDRRACERWYCPKCDADPVNPAHYQGDYVMRIIEDFGLGFRVGNVVKYCLRADNKNKLEDLEKARWYLDREIEARRK